jgi:hypothetical protein
VRAGHGYTANTIGSERGNGKRRDDRAVDATGQSKQHALVAGLARVPLDRADDCTREFFRGAELRWRRTAIALEIAHKQIFDETARALNAAAGTYQTRAPVEDEVVVCADRIDAEQWEACGLRTRCQDGHSPSLLSSEERRCAGHDEQCRPGTRRLTDWIDTIDMARIDILPLPQVLAEKECDRLPCDCCGYGR